MVVLGVPYVHFMVTVDIPMYYGQYLNDQAKGTVYYHPADGLRHMLTCQDVADDWAGWSEDALWMSLYFGVGPLMARALVASLVDELPVGRVRPHNWKRHSSGVAVLACPFQRGHGR